MQISKHSITENIFLLKFETQSELCSTFLRFQEHYESPEFRGKVFTLDEYKDWYSQLKGSFSYYTDWSGFNIPSYVLAQFKEGKFDPLTEEERKFLSLFQDLEDPYYIIGLHGDLSSERNKRTLKHEIAHGLFYTNEEYKKGVLDVLSKYNLEDFKVCLRSLGGYHEEVLDDEIHAYMLCGSDKLALEVPPALKNELETIFSLFCEDFKTLQVFDN